MRLFTLLFCMCCPLAVTGDEGPKFFHDEVSPLLIRRCLECHSGADPKGGFDLSSRVTAAAGGDSGPAWTAGKPQDSLLWERVRSNEMPPKQPLSKAEKQVLRQWIESGAVWGGERLDPFRFTTATRAGYDWWALQPLAPPPPPLAVKGRVRNGIDNFILARLPELGLRQSPPASRRVLIRRLSFDLLGLPPAPAEIAAFESDSRPGAYERLVDRLLASPQYGVRWARHWLDVARFGESQGFERDKIRDNAWPYRDWVVEALNRDLPYDEFVRQQIAGDVLDPDDPSAVIATGFLVAGPYDEVGQSQQSAAMKAVVREDELEDIVSVVSQTFLGLTANCARCHDHKFDPIRQREYYQLSAALAGVWHGSRDVQAALGGASPRKLSVYSVVPRAPGVGHLLLRGNPASKGQPVAPGGIGSLVGVEGDFQLKPDASDGQRRRRLAAWITHPDNPLFARVIANRLWHHHFGRGLVETPNDFGFNGGRPSHPELIDYLAGELRSGGWSLKSLHRSIVTSATYRQSSQHVPQFAAKDADNRLLWRRSPQRLDAESLRDSILGVSGQLNLRLGGPGFRDFDTFVKNTQFYVMKDPVGPPFNRRSIYRTWIRSGRSWLLDVFDCPDPSTKTPKRDVTVTPLQALALMNNSFVLRMSRQFSQRVQAEVGGDQTAQIRRAYELAFGRTPDETELKLAAEFVAEQGLVSLCRVIFNSNEFLYVD